MKEINLLDSYPSRKRNISNRVNEKTPEIIKKAKKFGWEYFDMKGVCYGGYIYDGRWKPVIKRFIDHYKLTSESKILDAGCAKGYMVYDFVNAGIDAFGIDISEYAINCAPYQINDRLYYCNVKDMKMFKDKQFDLVISINTIHNLKEEECRKAIREIERIGKHAFIMVDSYRNKKEKERMFQWNVVGETILSNKEWIQIFKEEGYTGDYFWFIP
jgi:ubiquinone/menaquinone biosynthesis C-methylase UbiE